MGVGKGDGEGVGVGFVSITPSWASGLNPLLVHPSGPRVAAHLFKVESQFFVASLHAIILWLAHPNDTRHSLYASVYLHLEMAMVQSWIFSA